MINGLSADSLAEQLAAAARQDLEGKVQGKYRELIQKGNFSELKAYMQILGIKPSEEIAQEGYLSYMQDIASEHYLLQTVKALKDATGVEPRLPEEVVQQRYLKLAPDFADNRKTSLGIAIKIKRLTGIKPKLPDTLVQDTFGQLIKGSYFDELAAFMKLIEGAPSEKLVQKQHSDYLSSGAYAYGYSKNLAEVTGIEPSISYEQIQDKYKKLMSNEKYQQLPFGNRDPMFGDEDAQHMHQLKQFSGIDPEEHLIQERYSAYAKSGDMSSLIRLMQYSKFQPAFSEKFVQEMYAELITPEHAWVGKAEMMHKATGIKPVLPYKVVQAAYKRLIDDVAERPFASLIELTGIQPSKELMKYASESYVENHPWALGDIAKVVKAESLEKATQNAYKKYAGNGELSKMLGLLDSTGLQPNSEATKALLSYLTQEAPNP